MESGQPARPGKLRVGLLVNPVAGLGGPGAFKGSDTAWREALAAGYAPTAPGRAKRFCELVAGHVAMLAPAGLLGEASCPGAQRVDFTGPATLEESTPQHTRLAAQALVATGVDLLCFVGGDGTATDVAHAVGSQVPCLGVPAGVKVTSPVFAHDVEEAAWLVRSISARFETTMRDVTDLDEEAYREGRLQVRLTGTLRVPLSPAVQGGKVPTAQTGLDGLIEHVLQEWDREALHLVGAGSVCQAVKSQFWGKPTILGIDAIDGNRIVETDLDDRRALALVQDAKTAGRRVVVTLSPIGGQGMLLGRGTQVLTPAILRLVGWDGLQVVAPAEKLVGVRALHVDTGDPDLDASAPKHVRVLVGWKEARMMRVAHGPQS